jgi:hypothetical protein
VDYPLPPGAPYPHTPFKWATRYRNVGTKRPVNIRNIQYSTSSVSIGNYKENYEVVQTAGRSINNKYFVDNEGIALPDANNYSIDFQTLFPETTTLSTLLGLKHGRKDALNSMQRRLMKMITSSPAQYTIMVISHIQYQEATYNIHGLLLRI